MTSNTMMTYINQEQEVCNSIISNRGKALKKAVDLIKGRKNKSWLILATGSSLNAAYSVRYFLEKILGINVSIEEPYNFSHYGRLNTETDLIIAISQSGRSISTIEALRSVSDRDIPSIVLTASLDSPVAAFSGCAVDIGCGLETVGFVTKGFLATVLTLMLFALETAAATGKIAEKAYATEIQKLYKTVETIPGVIKSSVAFYRRHEDDLVYAKRFMAIGYGGNYGVAKEFETKFTETVRVPSSGYELEAFMHGPYLEVNKEYRLFFIEGEKHGIQRLSALKDYFNKYTPYCYTVSLKQAGDVHTLGLDISVDDSYSVIPLVVPFQVLSYMISAGKGIDLSTPIFEDFDDVLKSKTPKN